MLFLMIIAMIVSSIMIYFKKKSVTEEEISVDNGYMHMKIVLILTCILSVVQLLQMI